jgi:hypothetical protein
METPKAREIPPFFVDHIRGPLALQRLVSALPGHGN